MAVGVYNVLQGQAKLLNGGKVPGFLLKHGVNQQSFLRLQATEQVCECATDGVVQLPNFRASGSQRIHLAISDIEFGHVGLHPINNLRLLQDVQLQVLGQEFSRNTGVSALLGQPQEYCKTGPHGTVALDEQRPGKGLDGLNDFLHSPWDVEMRGHESNHLKSRATSFDCVPVQIGICLRVQKQPTLAEGTQLRNCLLWQGAR
mmetsp:Transcript_6731/g.12228  ORF Transcript_6731/g.12228 Transcript_6731/m.12228 type:complete len:203 (+) Transcript_6731:765-1373(+)